MLRALADKGGVTGLNFCPAFLKANGADHNYSRIADMLIHLKHMIKVAGEDVLAIGTDFDGIGGDLEIGSPDKLSLLKNALSDEGIPPRVIDKIFMDNAKRVLSEGGKCD